MIKMPMFASEITNKGPREEYKQNIFDLNKQFVNKQIRRTVL